MDERINYSIDPPFHPEEKYPEYPFKEFSKHNYIYKNIREIFHSLDLDSKNYNTEYWNPLGDIIKPGNSVLIKPNLVIHNENAGSSIDHIITNSSIIRVLVDYVYIALKGEGEVTIADAPLQRCNFKSLIEYAGLDKLLNFYESIGNLKIKIVDFRMKNAYRDKIGRLTEDKLGNIMDYKVVNLEKNSEFSDIIAENSKFRVTNYRKEEMVRHHNSLRNDYLIPKIVLNSDIIINIPKLKTHSKAGISCALKNMLGTNGLKDWLPHHRRGSIIEGGDEYLNKSWRKDILTDINEKSEDSQSIIFFKIFKLIYFFLFHSQIIFPFKDSFFEGSWFGNKTIDRAIVDINKILLYANKEGFIENSIQRKMFILVDGIISGEGNGPIKARPKKSGILIGGFNPVFTDVVASTIMGFDYKKIPTIERALNLEMLKLSANISNIDISFQSSFIGNSLRGVPNLKFVPHDNWKEYIENKE